MRESGNQSTSPLDEKVRNESAPGLGVALPRVQGTSRRRKSTKGEQTEGKGSRSCIGGQSNLWGGLGRRQDRRTGEGTKGARTGDRRKDGDGGGGNQSR